MARSRRPIAAAPHEATDLDGHIPYLQHDDEVQHVRGAALLGGFDHLRAGAARLRAPPQLVHRAISQQSAQLLVVRRALGQPLREHREPNAFANARQHRNMSDDIRMTNHI